MEQAEPHGGVALVHDWLTGMRGGERVLEVLAELYPGAEIHTLFHLPGSVSPRIEERRIHTSFLQRMPFLSRAYRYALPLFPAAAESLDLSGHELVISSSHCVAKGVRTDSSTRHVCYCHTPMRYAWDRFEDYFGPGRGSKVPAPIARWITGRLRRWDRATAGRVDHFLANSRHVADRIRRYYDREAEVIPPPVDTRRFRPAGDAGTSGYLLVSALVPYKRVDVAVEAFRGGSRRLRVVGDGPALGRLRRAADGAITFLGRLDDDALVREYQRCRALIMPGVEDAGIVPLEAMACGRPVVARAEGGVPEVVLPPGSERPATGILYDGAGPGDLRAALDRFEAEEDRFQPSQIRSHAERYDVTIFRSRLRAALDATDQPAARREAAP